MRGFGKEAPRSDRPVLASAMRPEQAELTLTEQFREITAWRRRRRQRRALAIVLAVVLAAAVAAVVAAEAARLYRWPRVIGRPTAPGRCCQIDVPLGSC